MVVSGCPPSLHWERHQLLGLRMAIGVVLCEIGDTPASSISSHLPPRYRYWPLLTVTKLHSFFFTAVAVSGTIGYLTGYNFVGSSCVEVPAAQSLSRPRVLLHTSSIGTHPHPDLLATSALSCWAATSVTTCCTSVSCVVRFGHLPVLLFVTTEKDAYILHTLRIPTLHVVLRVSGTSRSHWGASYEVVLLYWKQRLPFCETSHRGPNRV